MTPIKKPVHEVATARRLPADVKINKQHTPITALYLYTAATRRLSHTTRRMFYHPFLQQDNVPSPKSCLIQRKACTEK